MTTSNNSDMALLSPLTGSLALRFAALPVDIQDALADVGEEMIRARTKFPGTKHLTAALMEEVGEVAKELLEDGNNVWGECVQTACVALRIATEGDAGFESATRGSLTRLVRR